MAWSMLSRLKFSGGCSSKWIGVCAAVGFLLAAAVAYAQEKAAAPTGFRKLAAGVETRIAPKLEAEDTVCRHDLMEILAELPDQDWKPNYEPPGATLKSMATNTVFRHGVWYLEFNFKPLRTIAVDIPQSDGTVKRKVVWYMVYRVRNLGRHMKPVEKEDGEKTTATIEFFDHAVRWFPEFTLESETLDVSYRDMIIPVALEAIRKREDPKREFLNCVDMSKELVPVSTDTEDHSVWGLATWQDVDLRIDFFKIYVRGLTNAYRWADTPGALKKGDPPGTGRKFVHKELQLNFWRPGDEFHPNDQEIYFGIPGQVDFRWVYR